jgi:anti-sigma B factor antagonist
VRAWGEIDIEGAAILAMQLRAASEASTRIVVDLTEVDFLDSTALGVLFEARRRVADLGGSLTVVLSERAAPRIFGLPGLDVLLPVARSVHDACNGATDGVA